MDNKNLLGINIVSCIPNKYALTGFYYNYKIVMEPNGHEHQGVTIRAFYPGVDYPASYIGVANKEDFYSSLADATSFIKQHYSRI